MSVESCQNQSATMDERSFNTSPSTEGSQRNFLNLISSRKRPREDLSEGSKTMLREAVLQLVNYHQDLNQVLEEATNLLHTAKSQESGNPGLCLENLGLPSLAALDFRLTEICANKYLNIVRQSKLDKDGVFSQVLKDELAVLIQLTKDMLDNHNFQRPRFFNLLCKESCLPLEVLWALHQSGVMTVESYLTFKQKDKDFVVLIVQQLCGLLENTPATEQVASTGFVRCLSQLAFPCKTDPEKLALKRVANMILDSTMTELIDGVRVDSTPTVLPVSTTGAEGGSLERVRKQYGHVLNLILTYQPTQSMASFSVQNELTYTRSSPVLVAWFKQLMVVFECEEVVDILRQATDRPVNWSRLLTLVATFVVCLPPATDCLLELVYTLLKTGLDGPDSDQLTAAFLLARQACLEGTHVTMSYQDWFQKMFGNGLRSVANNRKTFTVLLKFLTELVPQESTAHLKVHILRPPYVPPKCRELLTDYILLAKTRLADLKDPIDLTGETDDTDKRKITDQVEKDVQLTLAAFEGTNKVPSSVMEASIFRKPYFIGRFLPALLKPRPLPDVPDERMRFIDTLKRAEKIPTNMYTTYQTACRQEATRLLEGVFMDDEEDALSEMTMDPLEQLDHRLGQLVHTLTTGQLPQHHNLTVPELMSILREKLSVVLDTEAGQSVVPRVVTINVHSPQLSATHVKVVDLLLNTLCKVTAHCCQSVQPDFTWAARLIGIVGEFRTLHKTLYTRTWKLVMETGPSLADHHIQGVAMLLCQTSVQRDRFGEASVQTCDGGNLTGTLSHLVWSRGSVGSSRCMEFMLRLSTTYLQCVFSCLDGTQLTSLVDVVIPKSLITLFEFLCCRLLPEIRGHHDLCGSAEYRLTHLIYRSKKFTESCQNTQLTFKDWVTMEMTVSPDLDLFSFHERRDYHSWCVYQRFISPTPGPEGRGSNVREACSDLMEALLLGDTRHASKVHSVCGQCCVRTRTSPAREGRAEFMHLLQEMVTMLPETGSGEDSGSPWLLQQLSKAYKLGTLDNHGNMQREAILQHFIRLAMCLPSHLFFCDSVHSIKEDGLRAVCAVINGDLKRGMCEGCHFPLSVTQYLLQGLASCACYTDVSVVLESTPVLAISALINIHQLGPIIQRLQTDRTQDISFILVAEWLGRCIDEGSDSPPLEAESWMIAGSAVSMTIASEEVPKDLLNDLNKDVSPDQVWDTENVLEIFCHLVLAELTATETLGNKQERPALKESLIHVLQMNPSVLPRVLQPNTDQGLYTTEVTQRSEHLTLLRVLSSLKVSHSLRLPSGLDCVLRMFGSVVQLFDQGQTPEGIGCPTTKCFAIQDVLELSEFVKRCIKSSSPEHLGGIESKDLVKRCGADVYMAFKQRVSR